MWNRIEDSYSFSEERPGINSLLLRSLEESKNLCQEGILGRL